MAETISIDDLPGYRRRFVVTPRAGLVIAELEDDYHCMGVTVRHERGRAVGVEAVMHRAPWSTCPGAPAQLARTFTGIALAEFAERGEKAANCTHLHDLATLAAAHAGDGSDTVYDVLVADPVAGRVRAELRRDGARVFAWTLEGFTLVTPVEMAGMALMKLKPWLAGLDRPDQEAAKILRWGVMVAHGRMIPLDRQSDALKFPPACYTFQPETAPRAQRVGVIRDFSEGTGQPLDGRHR